MDISHGHFAWTFRTGEGLAQRRSISNQRPRRKESHKQIAALVGVAPFN